MRANYHFFETDDPELYTRKIKFILEHPVADLDLTFADDVVDREGRFVEMAPLKPNGGLIAVTDANKIECVMPVAVGIATAELPARLVFSYFGVLILFGYFNNGGCGACVFFSLFSSLMF